MVEMLERFQGEGGNRRLAVALLAHSMVCNDSNLAERIIQVGDLRGFDRGHTIINQHGVDNDVFLIVTGEVSVTVHGREVARRHSGQHVGELALLDPKVQRSASVVACEPSVLLRIAESDFAKLAEEFPRVWQRIARELGHRLSERNNFVDVKRERPLLFIGTSVEGLAIAQELQSALRHDAFTVRVWTDNVFEASQFPVDELENTLRAADFGLLVATPDDVVQSRGTEHAAPRDNVIFELGLVMGALSRFRSMILRPRGADLKLPTDLLGLTTLNYDADATRPLVDRVAPVATDIRKLVAKYGPR